MATKRASEVIHYLRSAGMLGGEAELTDGQLLECFVSRRLEAALESLVWRHAPMVWSVCNRVLRSHHDAEDAFQATFLVLVRKAASIKPPEMVGNWLYGVAHQTALKARATNAKRRGRERQMTAMPEPEVVRQDPWLDLQPLLDRELSRLPDKYRVAIVLCDLEGKTGREAARQLGLPEGTVASRLARARMMLAKRLARHGLSVSGGTLAAVLSNQAASAGVPSAMVSSTIKVATFVAAGQAAVGSIVSAKVAALMEGVLKSMLLNQLKTGTAVLLVVGMVAFGGGLLTHQQATGQAKLPTRPVEKVPAAAANAPEGLVEAARAAYEGYTQRSAAEPERVDLDLLYQWSQRWLEAERSVGKTKEKQVAAYAAHLDRMRALEAERQKAVEQLLAAKVELAAVKYYRLEAEQWLAKAKAP